MEEFDILMSGTHKNFNTILDSKGGISESDISNLKEGDLILRPMEIKGPFYHVGIYCEKSEVVDFAAKSDTPQTGLTGLMSASTAYVNGEVCKVGVKNFIKEYPCRVLRSSSGVSSGFSDRVMAAMNSEPKYNALTNNCLHFAMNLLGK
ncbi:hypothetical protein R3I94_022742 [Phoxinus phoxinus]